MVGKSDTHQKGGWMHERQISFGAARLRPLCSAAMAWG
jgi:hypothetical protein